VARCTYYQESLVSSTPSETAKIAGSGVTRNPDRQICAVMRVPLGG
jgi:hypothetical protein